MPRRFGFGFSPVDLSSCPTGQAMGAWRLEGVPQTGNTRKIAALGRGAGGGPTDPANEGRNRVPTTPRARPARLPRA